MLPDAKPIGVAAVEVETLSTIEQIATKTPKHFATLFSVDLLASAVERHTDAAHRFQSLLDKRLKLPGAIVRPPPPKPHGGARHRGSRHQMEEIA